jgi:iron complex outermembrane receptor protein
MNLKRLFVAMALSLFAFVMQARAQDKVVTGKVTDAAGAAVAGATIKIKGGKALGKTNSDGTFSVKAPGNGVLEFTSVGFTPVEMQVPASGVMNVSVKAGDENLNEVVVNTGYGSSRKKDLTGSVVSVSSKDFVKGALTTPEQLIAGKVAGVSVTPNGGAPGSGSTIRIRGGASISGSNDPLIIIDGVPLSNDGISGSANALNLINPNDIETFNILKDASATAIYGSRASAGVILITTKRGKLGKPTFNFSSNTTVYTPGKQIEVLSAQQFKDFVNANGKAADIALLGNANTNWQDEIFKTAIGSDNNLSMSGAIGKKTPFRASVGYLNQNGTLKGGNMKRSSASIAISPKFLKEHLKVDINLRGVVTESKFANEGAIGASVSFDPTKPVYSNSNRFGGYWEWLDPNSTTGLKSLAPLNPLGLLNQKIDKSHVERSIGNVQFEYKFHGFEDLKAVVNMGYDVATGTGTIVINDSAAMSYKRFKDANGKYHGGVNNIYRQEKKNTVLDAYLNYAKDLSIGRIDATVGYAYNDFKTTNYNYTDNTTDGSISSSPVYSYDAPRNLIISVFGSLKYSYKGKYLLTASARKDGASKFSKANRWGVFPSAAVGWRIKEEAFLKNVKAINDLKVRVGYGLTGQQGIGGSYLYQQNYYQSSNQSQYQFGNTFYNLYAPGGFNAAIKWEETKTINVGVDYSLFNNRVSGSIEYYEKKTDKLFSPAQQPAGSNFTNVIDANIGSMTNKGVDFNINLGVIRKKDLNWDLAFNINYNKNEITNLTLNDDPNYLGNFAGGISGGTGNTIQINSVGYARNAFYVYKQVYDPKTGKAIDGLFEDLNRDGTVNSSDLYRYKQPDPVLFLGLSSSVNYKQWNAGFVARANIGNYMYNNVASNTGTKRNIINPIGVLNNGSTSVLTSGMSGNGSNYYLSDYWMENASFFRMDNINIGYNFGKVFNNKANLRLSANVQNAFVITKYKGLDPEQSGGIDNNLYSRPRIFVLGIGLDF